MSGYLYYEGCAKSYYNTIEKVYTVESAQGDIIH
jgi:hypothetical protein